MHRDGDELYNPIKYIKYIKYIRNIENIENIENNGLGWLWLSMARSAWHSIFLKKIIQVKVHVFNAEERIWLLR